MSHPDEEEFYNKLAHDWHGALTTKKREEPAHLLETSRHEAKKGKKKLSPGVEVSRPGVEGVDRGQGSEKKDVS